MNGQGQKGIVLMIMTLNCQFERMTEQENRSIEARCDARA